MLAEGSLVKMYPILLWILTLLASCQVGHFLYDSSIFVAKFRTREDFGKMFDVTLVPVRWVPSVRSTLECVKFCSETSGCVSVVSNPAEKSCKLYDQVVSHVTHVIFSATSVYMEREDAFHRDPFMDHSTAYATSGQTIPGQTTPGQTTLQQLETTFQPFQVPECSGVSSCNQLDPTSAFRHKNGNFILLNGKDFWVYESVYDMCYGNPTSGPTRFRDLAEGFADDPEMLASTDDGQYLFIFKSTMTHCFQYNPSTATYQACASWQRAKINTVFGSNMPNDNQGHCFIAVNQSHGYMFNNLDVIYSNGATWDMKDSNPSNRFYMENPGNTVEACTDTHDPQYFLFFEAEKMYIYDSVQRKGTYIGKCCISS